jgi:hypothetical protein
MKKNSEIILIWIVFLCFSLTNFANAQLFGLRQSVPENYYQMLLKYPKDSLYRVYSIRYPSSSANNTIQPIIYVFGQNLKLKDSILLPKNHAFNFSGPIEYNNKLYWMSANNSFTCGSLGINICFGDTISVFEFNSNFSISSIKKITRASQYNYPQLVKYADGFVYAHWQMNSFPNNIQKVFKLNNQLNLIDSNFINLSLGNPIASIHNKIFLPGKTMPMPCGPVLPLSGIQQCLQLDTSLALVSCDTYSNLGTYGTAPFTRTLQCTSNPLPYLEEISPSKYIVFGSYLGPSSNVPLVVNNGVIVCIKNQNHGVVKTSFFLNNYYETSYSELAKFYDIAKGNIAFALKVDSLGYGNFKPTLNLHSKIMVVKMDTMGNVLWQKYYGGEQYYQPRGLIFTPDGGLLISGIRFDSTASAKKGMPGISESFLLKLDSAGNYNSVGIIEQNIKNIYALKVHPNPANNQIQFELPNTNSCAIVISALDGKQVYLNEHYVINTPINLEALPKGMYFYQIWTDKSFYTGKFLI